MRGNSPIRWEGGPSRFRPIQIARHRLFTAREKLSLLSRLKAEVSAERANPNALGFDPREIDRAIEEVRLDAETGKGSGMSVRNDN